MLQVRRVEHRAKRASEAVEANVLGYADNHQRVLGVGRHLKLAADGIFVWPELLGHRFTDNRDILSILVVGFGEVSATQQRNSHRRKIVGGNRVVQGSRSGLARWRLVSRDVEGIGIVVVAHGGGIGGGGGDDSGKRANTLQE